MYPLSDSVLPLLDLAKHWRRQLEGQPPSEEILGTLLQAFWQRTLVLCRADGKLVGRELLLQMVKAAAPHPGLLIYEDPRHPPPMKQELPDGGVTIHLGDRVYLPAAPSDWSDRIISEACSRLAACRWTDYSTAAQVGFASLHVSRAAFEALCVERGYERPPFWFGRESKGEGSKSFGGRPSIMRRIEAEMRHRAADGSLELTLREEAQALHTSATQNIPATEQIPTVRTIENRLRDVYRKLRRSGRGTHET